MPSAGDRLEFGPHRDPGALRAFGLALLVHLLLGAALTWGVNWKRSNPDISFEAELWSSLPQEAAPKLVEAPPPPPPPAPEPPQVKAPPPPPTPDVDIALEREKKRKLELQKKEAELLKAQKEKEKLKAELQAKKEKEQKAKEELAKRKAEEAKKLEAKKEEAKKLEAKKLEADKQEAQKIADQRKKNLERMLGQADATGAVDAKGTAQKSGGPSGSYAGKVAAKVLPNVVFTDDIAGNPRAEVEVNSTADGTIISQRLVKSSGNKAWDEAVIKAIIRTGTMPRDVDGRVPTPMTIGFRPKD